MPSIQDIAKKKKTKMFQQTSTRPLDEVLPFRKEEPLNLEQALAKIEVEKREFKKVPYRPWDDDQPSQGEGNRAYHPKKEAAFPEQLAKKDTFDKQQQHEVSLKGNVIGLYLPEIEKNTPARIIISLYGVQRNILKFLISNISHEEEAFLYTFPIDLKSIVMFTSSSKRTVETSIRRMKEKKIIESWDHKRGRGGYVTFRIPNILREEFLKQNNKPIQPTI